MNIVPPFHFKLPPCQENEAYLARVNHQKELGSILCNIEEICNISTSQETQNGPVSIEIARKNGIPLHLVIENVKNAWSFLTTLTGYYRLSEKWVFCLCPDVIYPSLNKLLQGDY